MFTNGASNTAGYNELLTSLGNLPKMSRVPEIANYVYGQSFEELQARLDKCIGSFLFIDYGEMSMSGNSHNSYELTQRIAVTVANKMPNRADAAEYMLASDNTLALLSKVHATMLADADRGDIEWLSRGELSRAEYVPLRGFGTPLGRLDVDAVLHSPRHSPNSPTVQVLCEEHGIG